MSDLLDEPSHDAEEDFIFNEYAIDDSLDAVSRLVRYYQSDFSLQRLVLARDLCDTSRFAGYEESVYTIVPLLAQFTSDSEPVVRQTLVQQLHPLAQFFVEAGGDAGYEYLLSTFLPMAFELLVDKNVEVGLAALQTIRKIAALVRPEHVQAHLLNVVITLAHDERAEDYRVVAAQLFNDLAEIFGPDLCASVVLPELELLSNDSSFSVRKTVGASLGGVCAVVTAAAAQEAVVTLYVSLCQDDIWGVRQACAESAEAVSLGLPEAVRLEVVVPAFQRLLEDNSRWVRNRAHESLGRLLHTLTAEDINPKLLQRFTDMAFQSESGDSEMSEYCAYSLPAVVQAVGRDRWGEIQDAYATMLKDVQWKVRKSLAYSLHELAAMLGTELAEESLVPAFELLLRDLDDIKLGIVVSVDEFLRVVAPATLDRLVPLLCHVPLESENWRLRNEVAKRIGCVGTLLAPTSTAFTAVIALVLRLLDDSVMEVRTSTYRPAALLLQHLAAAGQADTGNYLTIIVELADRPSFQGRQMFVYVTQQAVELGADDVVEHYLLDGLQKLCADPVDNVRLVVRKALEESFLPKAKWSGSARIQQMMAQLKTLQAEDETAVAAMAAAETEEQQHQREAVAAGVAAVPTTAPAVVAAVGAAPAPVAEAPV